MSQRTTAAVFQYEMKVNMTLPTRITCVVRSTLLVVVLRGDWLEGPSGDPGGFEDVAMNVRSLNALSLGREADRGRGHGREFYIVHAQPHSGRPAGQWVRIPILIEDCRS